MTPEHNVFRQEFIKVHMIVLVVPVNNRAQAALKHC